MRVPGVERRQMPPRVLLGGSFDPVHAAHLALADAAHEHGAAELIWVPAAQSPFKPDGPSIDDADRLALLQCALQGRARESIDLREWERAGPSFTVDTLRSFAEQAPQSCWAWLMGEDSLASFLSWKDAAEIAASAALWVAPRQEHGASRLNEHREHVQAALPHARIEVLGLAPQHARSSEIRALLARGEDPGRQLMPAAVLHEIVARQLYGWPGADLDGSNA